jgi:hypothetical protein
MHLVSKVSHLSYGAQTVGRHGPAKSEDAAVIIFRGILTGESLNVTAPLAE